MFNRKEKRKKNKKQKICREENTEGIKKEDREIRRQGRKKEIRKKERQKQIKKKRE